MDLEQLFLAATPEELAQGTRRDANLATHACLLCGERFEEGRVYEVGGRLYEAARGAQEHVLRIHGGTSRWLMEHEHAGLTETQRRLFACLLGGQDDRATAQAMGISASTVRNHRFQLRERARQARVFLALMRHLEALPRGGDALMEVHAGATMLDERYAVTVREQQGILSTYFPEGPDGPLREFPSREKRKLVVLKQLSLRFESGRRYTETEVNHILKGAWHDFATLRRYLIEYGFLDRQPDGRAYWVKEPVTGQASQAQP